MAYRPGTRDPRYRATGTVPLPVVRRPASPPPVPPELARRAADIERRRAQLHAHPGCQWQHGGVRCVGEAELVVLRPDDSTRSICERHIRHALFDRRSRVL